MDEDDHADKASSSLAAVMPRSGIPLWAAFSSGVGFFERLSSRRRRLLVDVVVILFLVWCVRSLFVELTTRNYSRGALKLNRQCSEQLRRSVAQPPPRGGVSNQCELPERVQFRKFVWLIVDAFPRWAADDLFEFYSSSIRMNVFVPGLKLSHSIFISFFTGEPTIYHWVNREIDTDCLVDSMYDANFTLSFIGYPRVVYEVLGQRRTSKFKRTYFSLERAEDIHSEPLSNEILHELMRAKEAHMSEILARGDSLLAYSTLYDTSMHMYGYEDPGVKKLLTDVTEHLKWFKGWIDAHPEYLLIINTDHGVDGPGGLLHGNTMMGNNGFLIFYNPRFGATAAQHGEIDIDVVDLCPTVAKYLRGVDIPTGSVGIARNWYPEVHNETYFRVMFQNLKQIYALAVVQGMSVSPEARLLAQMEPRQLRPEMLPEIVRAVEDLKAELFAQSSLSMSTFLANFVAAVLVIAFVVYRYNLFALVPLWRAFRVKFHRNPVGGASAGGQGLDGPAWQPPDEAWEAERGTEQAPGDADSTSLLGSSAWRLSDWIAGAARLAGILCILFWVYLVPFYCAWILILWHTDHAKTYRVRSIALVATPILLGAVNLFWSRRSVLLCELEHFESTRRWRLASWLGLLRPKAGLLWTLVTDAAIFICLWRDERDFFAPVLGRLPSIFLVFVVCWILWVMTKRKDDRSRTSRGLGTGRRAFLFYAGILGVSVLFELTAGWKALYFVFEFHVLAFWVYGSLVLLILFNVFLNPRGSMAELLIPAMLLEFFLQIRDSQLRLLSILGVLSFATLGKSLFQVLKELDVTFRRHWFSHSLTTSHGDGSGVSQSDADDGGLESLLDSGGDEAGDGSARAFVGSSEFDVPGGVALRRNGFVGEDGGSRTAATSRELVSPVPRRGLITQYSSLLGQGAVQLLVAQMLFLFCVLLRLDFDINMDPITGQIGRLSYDNFVWISAFFMAYFKYSYFFAFAAFLWFGVHDTTFYYLVLGCLVLLFCNVNIIFHEVLWRYMMADSFTELLLSDMLFGAVGIAFAGLDVVKLFVSPQLVTQQTRYKALLANALRQRESGALLPT